MNPNYWLGLAKNRIIHKVLKVNLKKYPKSFIEGSNLTEWFNVNQESWTKLQPGTVQGKGLAPHFCEVKNNDNKIFNILKSRKKVADEISLVR